MVIKHIVLSGGGGGGFAIYGALKYLSVQNFWHIDNIKSIYATSDVAVYRHNIIYILKNYFLLNSLRCSILMQNLLGTTTTMSTKPDDIIIVI